jgi:hypothetical protein
VYDLCFKDSITDANITSNLIGQYATGVNKYYEGMLKGIEDEKLSDLIYEILPLSNAGIMLGKISEYRAYRLAARFVARLHGDRNLVITEKFFNSKSLNNVEWNDKRLNSWIKELHTVYRDALPIISTWSQPKFWAECESLTYKIGAELSDLHKHLGKMKKGSLFQGSLTENEKPTVHPLTEKESTILEAIQKECLTGPQIAKRSGYPYDKDLKQKLSELCKRGVLNNKKDGKGYFLIPELYHLLDTIG